MTARDHASEILSLVRQSRATVYDGLVPDDAAAPYVAVYFDTGWADPVRVNNDAHWRRYTFQTTYVATTPEQLRWLVDKVEPELLGVTPDVYGVASSPLEKRTAQQVRRDFDVSPPLFYATDVWEYGANG